MTVGWGSFSLIGLLTVAFYNFATMSRMQWDNLFSGLAGSVFGSVVGGAIGAWATVYATQATIKASVKANEESLKKQQEDERSTLWRGLLTESKQNLHMLQNLAPNGVQLKVQFSATFWLDARSKLHFLSRELQDDLIKLHSAINQHNDIVLYDRHALDYGMGNVNGIVTNLQGTVLAYLQRVVPALERQVGEVAA